VDDVKSENTPEVNDAVKKLLLLLGPERILQLAQMLEDVATDTHFGDVKIVITDGRVRLLKVEKSYE
jgi:hypothetical protein